MADIFRGMMMRIFAFLRPEYEKFRKACKNELDRTKFYFQDHRNTKGYRWGYGKLRRKIHFSLESIRNICLISKGFYRYLST